MTDAQHLFDYARRQLNEIAADVERHFDLVADSVRGHFGKSLPPPPRRLPPPSTWQLVQRWVNRHRALTVAVAAFLITGSIGTVVYAQSRNLRKKRKAHKSTSGARTEVVVVAGAVANPLASALYLDLERRGFVVYVIANSAEDSQFIRAQSRVDLLPLSLDLLDPFNAQEQLSRFRQLFAREHVAFDGAEPHTLRLAGLILIPDTQSVPARIEDISSEEWSDALNAKVLNTIATTQLLLPAVVEHKARVLLLTPSVTPSLTPPMHAIESTVYGALAGFASSLAAELRADAIPLSHFKLGNIDIPAVTAKQRREGRAAPKLRPTSIRRLQDSVFDALDSSHRPRRVQHIGRGSLTYDVIGSWMPPTLISWMMGAVHRNHASVGDGGAEDLHNSSGSLSWEKVDQDA